MVTQVKQSIHRVYSQGIQTTLKIYLSIHRVENLKLVLILTPVYQNLKNFSFPRILKIFKTFTNLKNLYKFMYV
jgi:hypothetical protein